MNYTLRQLIVFIKICELKSITKAAESMHLTQPAASIQLKNFQDQFDLPLTEVIGRKLYVTPFGEEIYRAATRILNETRKMEQAAHAFGGNLTGKIKISVVSTGKYVMPYFLSDFIANNPGIELSMDVTNKSAVVNSIEKNTVDFSLVSVMPSTTLVDKIELMPNKLYLVGGRRAEQIMKPKLPSYIADLPLIYREAGSGTRQTMERFMEEHGIRPTKMLELTSNEAVKQAVIAGLGYSIMPIIGIRNELERGDLRIIPIKGMPIASSWNLIWLKEKQFLPPAAKFLEYLQNEKEAIIRKHFSNF
jgi:DNA-binding transcriptional LysR family regulator